MEDSQREAMYNAWADSKKWMRVEIYKSFTTYNDSINEWRACAEHTFGCVERPTRILAIQKIQGMLAERGYEISNLTELFGTQTDTTAKQVIKEESPQTEKRLTFLEWCKEVEWQRIVRGNNGLWIEDKEIPQHKLKDPSMDDKILDSYKKKYNIK